MLRTPALNANKKTKTTVNQQENGQKTLKYYTIHLYSTVKRDKITIEIRMLILPELNLDRKTKVRTNFLK